MKKWILLALNVVATLTVACFFLSCSYRLAFPLDKHDRQISIVELFMVPPTVISILWLLARLLRKERSETYLYKFCSWAADGKPYHRLITSIIGAIVLVGILKFAALLMRTVL
ncbi:hypothetical protein [Burkholderia ubonensis]|uniref:hypothetical protein n=1 Tax=Burkholderia ubonensis TaxID=101571 RepID=UPI0012F833FD|nr:hypothetical protein [Burkholderia ubonensis]